MDVIIKYIKENSSVNPKYSRGYKKNSSLLIKENLCQLNLNSIDTSIVASTKRHGFKCTEMQYFSI